MTIANAENCTPPSGHCSMTYLTEASDLRIAPGRWPLTIETTLGNGRPFIEPTPQRDSEGEFSGMLYRQLFGCIALQVLND